MHQNYREQAVMRQETIILAAPLKDRTEHRLAKHIRPYFVVNTLWDQNFYKPLQEIFSRVIFFDYPERISEVGVKGANEEIIELVRKEHAKYVLWIGAKYEFRESTFSIIRREGSTVIGWFLDDEFRFDNYSRWWIPYLDYCVTHDMGAVPKYRALGARVILTPPCYGIAVERDWSKIEEKYDVSFVGAKKADREQYINELGKRKILIHLFGKGWGGYISLEEMIEIFKTSKINLNFTGATLGNKKIGTKARIFEVCLAGGFLLTEYLPGIESYFEIDKEIVCFKNADEMIDKISYYLSHDEERRAIAQAGWKRATSEYTPFHMLCRVFDEIERDVAVKGKVSHPPESKMPRAVRQGFSAYYSSWLKAFSLENYKSLCKDAFVLSISYNPLNIGAWCYYLASFLPYPLRSGAYKLGRLGYHAVKR